MNNSRIIIIGPLPPPYGGARVSFKLFRDYLLKSISNKKCYFIDLPLRYNRSANPPGSVNHFATIAKLLRYCNQMISAEKIIVFGSSNFCFTYGLLIVLFCKLFNKHCFIRFFGGFPMFRIVAKPKIVKTTALRILYLADKILVQTHAGANEFPQNIRQKIVIIPGYRPQAHQSSDRLLAQRNRSVRFVYAGYITRRKGVPTLIKAFLEVQQRTYRDNINVELHLYGAGGATLVNRFKSCRGIYYHGVVENRFLREIIASYDVFCFPSQHLTEGHPGVLIEALMAGLPVVASNVPAIGEVVEDGFNGLIVEAGNLKALVGGLERLARDFLLREEIGKNALASSRRFLAESVLYKMVTELTLR